MLTRKQTISAGVGAAAVALAAGGWWLARTNGWLGRPGEDVKVITQLPPDAVRPAPSGSGGFTIPTTRPPHRQPVDIAPAEVPSWFPDAARARREPAPTAPPRGTLPPAAPPAAPIIAASVARPADPLAGVRPVLARARPLSAWFARWQADLGAERPTSDARLGELERLVEAEAFTPDEVTAVGSAIAVMEGPGGRTRAAWDRAAAKSARPAGPATRPGQPPGRFPWGLPAVPGGGPTTRPVTPPAAGSNPPATRPATRPAATARGVAATTQGRPVTRTSATR